jgi:hypothetical protein
MSEAFRPAMNITVYCRFCKKVLPAQLDRSIAANGKTVDRESTFEYSCSKCSRTFCFPGTDLPDGSADAKSESQPRDYSTKLHYLIGDVVHHKKFKEQGSVVCKESGEPSRILVHFAKAGMKKLVEDVGVK